MEEVKEMIEFEYDLKATTPVLKSNMEELEEFVQKVKESYVSKPVNASNKTVAKKDLALLRSMLKQITGKLTSVKKDILKPYNDFKMIVDEKLSELTSIETELDNGIKKVEQEEKDQKKIAIKTLLEEMLTESGEVIHSVLKEFFRPEWLNISYSVNNIKKDIADRIEQTTLVLSVIKGNSHEAQLLDTYKTTWNYASVVDEKERLDLADRRFAELETKRKEQEERKRAEEEAEKTLSQQNESKDVINVKESIPISEQYPEQQYQIQSPVLVAQFMVVGLKEEIASFYQQAKGLVGIKRVGAVSTATPKEIEFTEYLGGIK